MSLDENSLTRLMELTRTADVVQAHVGSHPHLCDYVATTSQAAKAKVAPTVHISSSPMPFAFSQNDKITLSEGLCKAMGMENQFSPLTVEMKAALAHEITHHTESSLTKTFRLVPIFAAPLVALAALDLYERHAKNAKTPHEAIENINAAAQGQSHNNDATSKALRAGKYLAVAAIGTAAGLYFTGKFSKHLEFKADLGSFRLTGDKQAMINALQQNASYTESLIAETKELQSKLLAGEEQAVSERILAYVKKPLEWAKEQFHAHPSTAQRIEHLASL